MDRLWKLERCPFLVCSLLVGGLGWAFIMSPVSWKTDLVLLFADFLCTRGHAYLLGHPPLYIIIRRWRISLSLSLLFLLGYDSVHASTRMIKKEPLMLLLSAHRKAALCLLLLLLLNKV